MNGIFMEQEQNEEPGRHSVGIGRFVFLVFFHPEGCAVCPDPENMHWFWKKNRREAYGHQNNAGAGAGRADARGTGRRAAEESALRGSGLSQAGSPPEAEVGVRGSGVLRRETG